MTDLFCIRLISGRTAFLWRIMDSARCEPPEPWLVYVNKLGVLAFMIMTLLYRERGGRIGGILMRWGQVGSRIAWQRYRMEV